MLKPLVVLVGPTATGKSAVAIELARQFNGEIVSGDSTQVYRGLDVGTAKVTPAERKLVPHHLIDIVNPEEPFSVADFQKMATQTIAEIHRKSKLPILVGGTGLYIRSVVDPYEFAEVATDLSLRHSLQQEAIRVGEADMHRRLEEIDPSTAERIHPGDIRRVIRALEVYYLTGQPISSFHHLGKKAARKYNSVWVGLILPRELLYQRIGRRVDQMLEAGLVNEVKRLLAEGVDPRSNSMQALGYKEIIKYLKGDYDLSTAVDLIKRNTRRFAKRQLTWFRRDSRIHWFDVASYPNLPELIQKICLVVGRTININVE